MIDEDTSVKDLKYVRSEVGFVSNSSICSHLTIMENITLAPMKVKGMSKADSEVRALELLESRNSRAGIQVPIRAIWRTATESSYRTGSCYGPEDNAL